MVDVHSFSLMKSAPQLFIHSTAHLGCFEWGVIRSQVSVDILTHISWSLCASVSLGYVLRGRIAVLKDMCLVNFIRNCQTVSESGLLHLLREVCENSDSSSSLSVFGIIRITNIFYVMGMF